MRRIWQKIPVRRLAWIVLAGALSALVLARGDFPSSRDLRLQELPPEALATLTTIQSGGPYSYERDGTRFGNYEKLLPMASPGHYLEYTVTTPGVRHRGARRIVVGCMRQQPVQQTPSPLRLAHCRGGGEFYYTADNYRSFKRIVE